MRVMLALASRALDAGLPLDATTSLARLAQDEARHATLCARMADALGGQGARALAGVSCAATDDGLPAGLFFAKWTLSLLCVGESASLAMLGALRRRATDPCARAVVAAILRDEVVHERVGWDLAARIVRTLTPSERGWLTGELSASFAHYASIHAGGGDPIPTEARSSTNAHAINIGMLPIERSARAFHGRVARVIVPRLEAIGLDARRAWAVSARAR